MGHRELSFLVLLLSEHVLILAQDYPHGINTVGPGKRSLSQELFQCQLPGLVSPVILLPIPLVLGLVEPTQQISICASHPYLGKDHIVRSECSSLNADKATHMECN